MTSPRVAELVNEAELKAGRLMTRLNKIKVGPSPRQQLLLSESQDFLGDALDALQAAGLEIADEEYERSRAVAALVEAAERVLESTPFPRKWSSEADPLLQLSQAIQPLKREA